MTKELLKEVNDLYERISSCKMLSEVFNRYDKDKMINLQSIDRKCSYVRALNIPDDLINELENIVVKYVAKLEDKFEKM